MIGAASANTEVMLAPAKHVMEMLTQATLPTINLLFAPTWCLTYANGGDSDLYIIER